RIGQDPLILFSLGAWAAQPDGHAVCVGPFPGAMLERPLYFRCSRRFLLTGVDPVESARSRIETDHVAVPTEGDRSITTSDLDNLQGASRVGVPEAAFTSGSTFNDEVSDLTIHHSG